MKQLLFIPILALGITLVPAISLADPAPAINTNQGENCVPTEPVNTTNQAKIVTVAKEMEQFNNTPHNTDNSQLQSLTSEYYSLISQNDTCNTN